MITDSLSSSGRRRRTRRRRKSWAEISHALIEIWVVGAEATPDKRISVSRGYENNHFFPVSFSPSPPSPLKSFFSPRVVSPKWGRSTAEGVIHTVPYIWDVTSSLAPQPQTVLSGRNRTTFLWGPLNLCLIQAAFWDSTHPYVASYATRSQLYQVQ